MKSGFCATFFVAFVLFSGLTGNTVDASASGMAAAPDEPDEPDEIVLAEPDADVDADAIVLDFTETEDIDMAELEDGLVVIVIAAIFLLSFALLVAGLVTGLRADRAWRSELKFYPVSMTKFTILSLMTFGLYAFFWTFKNWRWFRENRDSTVMPFWRVFFQIVWFYSLLKRIRMESYDDAGFPRWQAIVATVVFIPAWIWSSVFDRIPTSLPLILGFAAWLWLLPVMFAVSKINRLNLEQPELVRKNSRFGFLAITAIILGAPLFLYTIGYVTNLIPTVSMTKGAHLWSWDRAYIERIGAVAPDESITYFYSAAFISIASDGNMLTDQGIASYWQEEGQAVQVVFATFDEIEKISVEEQGGFAEDSTVLVTTIDGREIYLYLPAEAGADKLFLQTTRRRVAAAKGL